MSTVTTTAPYPDASARATRLAATSRSLTQYSWNQRAASPIASATSSIECEAALERISGTSVAAEARATASSPSSCASERTPTGASRNGAGDEVPSTVTERSRSRLPRSIRGRSRRRSNASEFARIVDSEPAPPAM